MSKNLNESIVRNSSATSRSGATIGRVIQRNLNQFEARSTSAASYRCGGTAERPASEISIMNGDHIQVSTITREVIASRGLESHSWRGWRSTDSITKFISPFTSSKMNFQNRPTTTGDSIIGTSSSVVMNPFSGNGRFSSI